MIKKTGTKKKTIIDFNRHQIGSVDLSDLVCIEKLPKSERMNYLQKAESIWNNPVFQNEIKYIIQLQLEYIGMEGDSYEKINFARGTINGVDLFRERFSSYHNEYIQAIRPEEKFNQFEIVPEE